MQPFSSVDRAMVIGLDGATFTALSPLVERGILPNLGSLMRESATRVLESTLPTITPTAWTTALTGCDPARHGILDYRFFDARRRSLHLNDATRIHAPTLFDALAAAGDQAVALNLPMTHPAPPHLPGIVVGGLDAPSLEAALRHLPQFASRLRAQCPDYTLDTIWKRRPRDFEELSAGVARTCRVFHARSEAALLADAQCAWRVMIVHFQNLDSLQHRCWHLLDVDGQTRAPSAWSTRLAQALRALDDAIGRLIELADRRGAAVVTLSDHGFGPFRQKISVPEILGRAGLSLPPKVVDRAYYRASRTAWKLRRFAARGLLRRRSTAALERPLSMLAPIDWRRSRAVTLHGNLAAMVYLITPERFGQGAVANQRQYDETLAETLHVLCGARHPATDEPLFARVDAMRDLADDDPCHRDWPDVVAIPAAGFHTRAKADRVGRVVRDDANLTGTHRRDGVLLIRAPGVRPGAAGRARLADVAPTLLALLDRQPVAPMDGRPLVAAPAAPSRADSTSVRPVVENRNSCTWSTADERRVARRLRELGYLD